MQFWHAFALTGKFGPQRFLKLLQHFNSMEEAWKAKKSELIKAQIKPAVVSFFCEKRKKINPEKEWLALQKLKIKLTTQKSHDYPQILTKIPYPPALIYYRGRLPEKNELLLGVVGSRRHSEYGKRCVNKLVSELSGGGIRIVSGLALGIDALAHRACLAVGTPTFAVLASGVDRFSPGANASLGQAICQTGGVLSEYPPHTGAKKQNFYARNRLISGLSQGLLVIEAGPQSGTFLTVNHALDQNKDVFAVPGEIFSPFSLGSHQLIQEGAKLVSSASQIREFLAIPPPTPNAKVLPKTVFVPQNNLQKLIIRHLTLIPTPIDKLVCSTKLKINVLLSQLTELEILGVVSRSSDQFYLNQ